MDDMRCALINDHCCLLISTERGLLLRLVLFRASAFWSMLLFPSPDSVLKISGLYTFLNSF